MGKEILKDWWPKKKITIWSDPKPFDYPSVTSED